jgi:hypothetical protein
MPARPRNSAAGVAKPARPVTPARPTKSVAADWTPPVTNEAVVAKTGRSWAQWIAALDAAGCAAMNHAEIVKVVSGSFDVGPWWRQTVTVGYERARGLRQVHETTKGFAASGSKTVNAGIERLWQAWDDEDTRRLWLPEDVTVRKATAMKSIRLTWHDGSDVQGWFTDKGAGKSSVSVDHRKLQQAAVESTKAFWRARLAALKVLLESGSGTGGRGPE